MWLDHKIRPVPTTVRPSGLLLEPVIPVIVDPVLVEGSWVLVPGQVERRGGNPVDGAAVGLVGAHQRDGDHNARAVRADDCTDYATTVEVDHDLTDLCRRAGGGGRGLDVGRVNRREAEGREQGHDNEPVAPVQARQHMPLLSPPNGGGRKILRDRCQEALLLIILIVRNAP